MAVCTFFIYTGIIEIQKFKAPYLDKLSSNSFHLQTNLLRPKLRQFTADLVTFTEEILNGKLHFLCRDIRKSNCSQNCLDINKNQP